MISNSNSPIDVTLNKTTGTWEVPTGNTTRQIKPWQRLWFVSGVIYLLMLAGSYYMLIPNQQLIERKMIFSVMEEVKRYDGMAFAGESPKRILEDASSQGHASWVSGLRAKYQIGPEGKAGFDRIDKEYRDAISGLPAKRNLGVIICIVAWLLPMSVLYAIGLVVAWIKRGFGAMRERVGQV